MCKFCFGDRVKNEQYGWGVVTGVDYSGFLNEYIYTVAWFPDGRTIGKSLTGSELEIYHD